MNDIFENEQHDSIESDEAFENAARQAALRFAMHQEMTEEDWEVLHDWACGVLMELDVSAVTDDDLPF